MQRALLIGATGSVVLYSAYMLIHGETPRAAQRLQTTLPAPIRDRTQQPAVSGSVTSLTYAIAQDGNDPHLSDRPVPLGGDQANTGHQQDPVSFTSLEQQQTLYLPDVQEQQKKAFCEKTYKNTAVDKQLPVFASTPGGNVPLTTAASLGMDLGDVHQLADQWVQMGYDKDAADALAHNDCVINLSAATVTMGNLSGVTPVDQVNFRVRGQPPQSVVGIAADGYPIATF